jgi:hypothetical protein
MRGRVLIYGMHGYRNLGAESRLVAMVRELRRRVPDAEVVTNSLDRTALDYLKGDATVRYFPPAAYRPASKRLIDGSDCVILSEGAMIGDRFSPALVNGLTRALEHAQGRGIATVGLALDSNYLSPARRARTVAALNRISLLTVRAPGADRGLAEYGVTVPMPVTADCAVSMPLPGRDAGREFREQCGLDDAPIHAIAPVDFFMWPALLRPLGRRSDFVRWPYRGTWPDGGRRRSEELVRTWVAHARHLLSAHPRARVMIVLMDRGDVRFGRRIHAEIGAPERTFVLDGQRSTPTEISAALGQAETLTSSRYHALVLSSAYAVPAVAFGHDNRTRFFCRDLGLERYWVPHDTPDPAAALRERHGALLADREAVRARIATGFAEMRVRDARNYELLGDVLAGIGYRVERVGPAAAAA